MPMPGMTGTFTATRAFGIDRFEFFDKLSKILNRVNIMIVGRRDQIHAGPRMPRRRHFLRDLARGQVTAFTGLRSLTHFDLQQVCGIDRFSSNPKTTGCNLNAAVERIFPEQIGNFTALSVD